MVIYASNSGIYNYKLHCNFFQAEYSTILILFNTEHKLFSVTHYVCVSSKLAQVVKPLTYPDFHGFTQSILVTSG
jgi:hypothetical protein